MINLVIAPHADDEILGCGATISKISKKEKVYILILTDASKGNNKKYSEKYIKNIRKEALKAHKILGISNTYFHDFPAPKLDQYPSFLISDLISKYINKLKPKRVFIPNVNDAHIDHKITHHASLVSLRPINKFVVDEILSYEVLSETEWSNENNYFSPNLFIKINQSQLNKKIKAFECFKSQIKKVPHPRSIDGIVNLAKIRGQIINTKFAESFKIIRKIK